MSFETPLTTKVVNPRLRLLNALRKGLKPVMTFLGLPSIRTAQVVAQTGLDVRKPATNPERYVLKTTGHNNRLRAWSY